MLPRHSSVIRRKRLGAELRRIRREAGLTGADLALRLDWSESKVSRIETARIGLSLDDARRFVDSIALDGEQCERFLALAEDAANTHGWWNAYRNVITTEQRMVADVEAGAAKIAAYMPLAIPGLLQTADYARGVLQWYGEIGVGPSDIDAAVTIRMARQQVLREEQFTYDVLLDQAALRRNVVSAGFMRQQLCHLQEMSEQPGVRIRLLPFERATPSMVPPATHPFQIYEFRDPVDPPLVSIDSLTDLRYLSDSEPVGSTGCCLTGCGRRRCQSRTPPHFWGSSRRKFGSWQHSGVTEFHSARYAPREHSVTERCQLAVEPSSKPPRVTFALVPPRGFVGKLAR